MGTRGRGDAEALVIGSVSRSVLKASPAGRADRARAATAGKQRRQKPPDPRVRSMEASARRRYGYRRRW
jgi:hypothetical protein